MDLGDSLNYLYGAEAEEPLPQETDVSLIDLMTAIERYNVPILCISPHRGTGILGRGASGQIRQSIVDYRTSLAFKNSTPNKKIPDDELSSDWASLINELAILHHGSVIDCPSIIDLVGITWEYIGESVWPRLITPRVHGGSLDMYLHNAFIEDDARLAITAHVLQGVTVLHGCGE
jgi:hypothetical protein